MTLLDAPAYDAARARRLRIALYSGAGLCFVLFITSWFVAGRPIDWPWNWWTHLRGRMVTNSFYRAVQHDDMKQAYAIWTHDPDWQQHPQQHGAYPFDRFEKDWGPDSAQNDYGTVRSHRIVATRINGNVLILGIYVNGQKSNATFLYYDPHDHTLGFSPVQLYLGP